MTSGFDPRWAAAIMLALGLYALFAPYRWNVMRLRSPWEAMVPPGLARAVPRVVGAGLLAGGLSVTVLSLAGVLGKPAPELFAALRARDGDKVERLLVAGANVNAREGESRFTPLILAAGLNDERSVRLLLARKADVNARDWLGQGALFDAALEGNVAIARLLLEAGAEADAADDDGVTPLFFAAHEGHLAVAQLLLERGANAARSTAKPWGYFAPRVPPYPPGLTPARAAEARGHAELKALLEARAARGR